MTTDVQSLITALQRAKAAPEPGSGVGSLRQIQDAEKKGLSSEIVQAMMTSAGYSYCWNTLTGERIQVNNNMLLAQLSKRREDGELAFALHDPHIVINREKHLCLLHKDAPNRKQYDQMGFPVCPQGSIPNEYEVTRHMQIRHKAAWAAIQAIEAKAEKQRAEDFQQDILRKMSQAVTEKRGRPKRENHNPV